jgi:hypothetical protein
MTLREAQAIARQHGMVIKSIPDCGEYVVNYAKREKIGNRVFGGEPSAYYATDLGDAVDTMLFMYAEMRDAWQDETPFGQGDNLGESPDY